MASMQSEDSVGMALNNLVQKAVKSNSFSHRPNRASLQARIRRTSSMPDIQGDVRKRLRKIFRMRQSSAEEPIKRVTFHEQEPSKYRSSFFINTPRYRTRNRLMQQDGVYNISLSNEHSLGRLYYSDMWTTLIEVKWRWALLVFSMGFILSWLFFSVIYFCIIYAHGDLHNNGNNWTPCIVNVNTFAASFLFSLETQTTIGYGHRNPSDACPEVIYAVCLQTMCGVVIQALMVGVVFAKLVRPKKRAQTVIFSRSAVVSMRDNRMCFMFRLGNVRKSQLANINLRAFMIRKHITAEGEVLPFYLHEMNCKVGAVDGCPLLTWPVTVCHKIDEDSPLYEYSADELARAKFEIHVVLHGIIPINGLSTQARTSYLATEIMWGYRLDGLMAYQRENGEYRLDYSKFHTLHPIWTPTCSARQLDHIKSLGMDPSVWYEETRKRAEMIDSPDHTFTPDAPAPPRRKLTDIFSKDEFELIDEQENENEKPIDTQTIESSSLLNPA